MLFDCEIVCTVPSISTGANGLPVATMARPSVHVSTSEGTASHLLVGFDSAITTGRSTWDAIARIAASVNSPGLAVAPTRTVGRNVSTTWTRSFDASPANPRDSASTAGHATSC